MELKHQAPEPELRAARVNEEVLGIEDGVIIYRPTPAQQKILELEDRQRVLALGDRDRSEDRPRGRRPTESGPPLAFGDRAASRSGGSRSGGSRRPETLKEKRARFLRQIMRGHELIREGPD